MEFPTWFDVEMQRRAIELSRRSYERATRRAPSARTIPWHLFNDELLAFVEEVQDDAFVVFRGTLSDRTLGNWLFTNFQAYKRSTSRGGHVHQGFWRAYCLLWDDEEGPPPPSNSRSLRQYLFGPALALLLLGVSALLWWLVHSLFLGCGTTGLVIAAILVGLLLQLVIERGWLEGLFRAPAAPPSGNSPISSHVERLNAKRRVVFIGHSLGGALATIAFSQWQSPNRHLITLGAPRVGDREFIERLEREDRERIVALVNNGDPVAAVPPTSSAAFFAVMDAGRPWEHPLRALAARALYSIWGFYRWCYVQTADADWNHARYKLGGDESLPCMGKYHSLDSYESQLVARRRNVQSRDRAQPAECP